MDRVDSSSCHRGWVTELSADTALAIQELCDSARKADGIDPVGQSVVQSLAGQGSAQHLVWHSDSGEVIGYANIVPGLSGNPAMAELLVHPKVRGNGLGSTLVSEVFAKAGENSRIWAHGNLPAAAAVARKLDLVSARELLQLRKKLNTENIPELIVPHDIVLRNYAGSADDSELLRVNNAAFSWHPEQGGWAQSQIDERINQPWFDPQGLFLAFSARQPEVLLGFHWTKLHAEERGTLG
ncbi:MAG: mycothiol synthase, partial [Mycobacteriaceae bacterium]